MRIISCAIFYPLIHGFTQEERKGKPTQCKDLVTNFRWNRLCKKRTIHPKMKELSAEKQNFAQVKFCFRTCPLLISALEKNWQVYPTQKEKERKPGVKGGGVAGRRYADNMRLLPCIISSYQTQWLIIRPPQNKKFPFHLIQGHCTQRAEHFVYSDSDHFQGNCSPEKHQAL